MVPTVKGECGAFQCRTGNQAMALATSPNDSEGDVTHVL